jgi:hypothetical protein
MIDLREEPVSEFDSMRVNPCQMKSMNVICEMTNIMNKEFERHEEL